MVSQHWVSLFLIPSNLYAFLKSVPERLPPSFRDLDESPYDLGPDSRPTTLRNPQDLRLFTVSAGGAVNDDRHHLIAQTLLEPIRINQDPERPGPRLPALPPPLGLALLQPLLRREHGGRAGHGEPGYRQRHGGLAARAEHHLAVRVPARARQLRVPQRGEHGRPGGVERVPVERDEEQVDVQHPVGPDPARGDVYVRRPVGVSHVLVVIALVVVYTEILDVEETRGVQEGVEARAERLCEGRGGHAGEEVGGAARRQLDVRHEEVVVAQLVHVRRRRGGVRAGDGRPVVRDLRRRERLPSHAAYHCGIARAHDRAAVGVGEGGGVDGGRSGLCGLAAVCAGRGRTGVGGLEVREKIWVRR